MRIFNSGSRCYTQRLAKLVEISHPFILISQIQRSGGTLLSQLFDGHPQCFAHPSEVTWGRPKKWNWPNLNVTALSTRQLFRHLHEEWIDRFAKDGFYKKSPKRDYEPYPFVFDLMLQSNIFGKLAHETPPQTTRQALDYYLTSFFNAWLDYQNLYAPGKKFVSGFIPRLVMHQDSLRLLFDSYPDSFVVSSIRHPAGWYSSAMKHGYEKHGDIEAQLQFWMQSTKAIMAAREEYRNRVIIIRFEDLVREPARVMRNVAKITGLSWNETLARPTFNSMPILSNTHYQSVDFVDPSVGDNYKKVLSVEEVDLIEKITKDVFLQSTDLINSQNKSFDEVA